MKNTTYLLAVLLTILCHLTQAQKHNPITLESTSTTTDEPNIIPYTKGELSTIFELPVERALELKTNTQERLNNLGAPTRYSKTSLLVDNKAVFICTDKKPDSTERKNSVILNHTEEWIITDNQGKDWYLKDKVINYTPENIVVEYYPISGNKISLPVNSGEFYQGVIWYKTILNPTENVPINIQKTSAIKRYAPYLIPLAFGAMTLTNQPISSSKEGVKKNNLLPVGLNIAGVLATVGILNHQKKKQRAVRHGQFKATINTQVMNKSDIIPNVPTMVMEVYSTNGKLVSKTTQRLLPVDGNWQASQVAQTIPSLPEGKGNLIVSIEGTSSSFEFSQHGFGVKQISQNTGVPFSNTQKKKTYTIKENIIDNHSKKLNTSMVKSHNSPLSNQFNLNIIPNNFRITNPLNGISLATINNSFANKMETTVQGFQIGSIVESNTLGMRDLDFKLMDAIGNIAINIKAKTTQTIQEKAQKVIALEYLSLDVFDMKNNVNIKNITENYKILDNIDIASVTSRYLPVLKKWAKNKGYEKIRISNKQINLLQEKLTSNTISLPEHNEPY